MSILAAIIRAAASPKPGPPAHAYCRRCFSSCPGHEPVPERWTCNCGRLSFDLAAVARWQASLLDCRRVDPEPCSSGRV